MKLILECAINYDSMDEAKSMILKCKELDVFLCKFQLFNESNIVNPEHKKFCMERMLDYDKAKELFNYGRSIGQEVFFTCDFPESLDWIERMGCKFVKTRFYDRFNIKLMEKTSDFVSKNKATWFLSINQEPLEYYNDLIAKGYNNKFDKQYPIFNALYCVPNYPALLRSYLNTECFDFGSISDHTNDLRLFKIAKMVGFRYFERHVCLKKEGCLEAEWASEFSEIKEAIKD